MNNILKIHRDLTAKMYRHGGYIAFKVNDPKPRDIHKASVRDRLVHHAICRILYPYFDQQFIFDSYSSRTGKGTHKAMDRLNEFARKVSRNHTRTAWVLKCDIKKFFANINHGVLKAILSRHIRDSDTLRLLGQIIDSFQTAGKIGVGLPLGNLTSQLLINVYMNEFDQFVKRELKVRYYIRFADDFVFLHEDRAALQNLLPKITNFLETKIRLSLHPNKIFLKTFASGVDFLGWVHFPKHRVLRTSTKRRIFKKLQGNSSEHNLQSYHGVLKHGDTFKLRKQFESLRD